MFVPQELLSEIESTTKQEPLQELLQRAIEGDAAAAEVLRERELAGVQAHGSALQSSPNKRRRPDEPSRRRVGIWISDGAGRYLRDRSVDTNERRLWADQQAIGPRCAGLRRVVMIGESVARGFFLDPWLTPSIALQHLLGAGYGEGTEVIDLARTCLTDPLKLFAQALSLQPDVAVLFVGNNLLPVQISALGGRTPAAHRLRAAHALACSRQAGEEFASQLDETVRQQVFVPLLDAIAALADAARVPVVFVLPETNHSDWRFASPWTDAASAATGSIALHRPPVPWCSDAWRRAVRDVAHGCPQLHVVDLAETFAAAGPVDRSVFYDYCHLTPHGLWQAMAAAAAGVNGASKVRTRAARPGPLSTAPAVLATAAFLAAVHNAHWGQALELVDHWLDDAIAQDVRIVHTFAAYCGSVASAVPPWMSAATAGLFDPASQTGRALFQSQSPANETVLLDAIARRLPRSQRQVAADARKRIACRLRADSMLEAFETDQFAAFAFSGDGAVAHCFDTLVCAPFVAEDSTTLHLSLVLRLGDTSSDTGIVKLRLNDRVIAIHHVSTRWMRVSAMIAPGDLIEGVNRLSIEWPAATLDEPLRIRIARAYVDGERSTLQPCTGEIHRSSRWVAA